MAQWSIPVAIPNQTSKTTSALAYVQGRLHLIHLGDSSNQLWHSFWDGTRWSDNVRIGKESNGRAALTSSGLLVYRDIYAEPDGAYGLIYSILQAGWPQARPLPDRITTDDSPAAVATLTGTTVVRQVPHQDYAMSNSNYIVGPGGVQFLDSGVLGVYSAKVPALASSGYGLDIIYTYKGSKDLWHGGRQIPNQSSKATPAAAYHNGVLHMVHLGESSDDIWHTTFVNGQWTADVRIPNHLSGDTPALASAPDGLHMVHKGQSSNLIWHSIYR
jgi:hypothetical protein